MTVGDHELVDEVFILDLGCGASATTALLRLVDIDRLRLGVAAVRQRDDDVFLRNQIFDAEIRLVLNDLCAPLVAVVVPNLDELGLDDFKQHIRVCKNIRKRFNFIQYLFVFIQYFFLL